MSKPENIEALVMQVLELRRQVENLRGEMDGYVAATEPLKRMSMDHEKRLGEIQASLLRLREEAGKSDQQVEGLERKVRSFRDGQSQIFGTTVFVFGVLFILSLFLR
ncbi:MAG: hypothetical protein H7831_03975 [Magnetococcus sp. WYHC-3]